MEILKNLPLKQSYGRLVRSLIEDNLTVQINYVQIGELDSCTVFPPHLHEDYTSQDVTTIDQWLAILNDQDIIRITEVKEKNK
jgi:hypothetical protein